MTGNPLPSSILIVTERTLAPRPLDAQIAALVSAGARWVWFRDKDLPRDERRALALRLRAIVEAAGGRLSVGGDIDLAHDVGSGAAHVSTAPQARQARIRLGAGALVGVSAHSLADVEAARDAGANYATLSPIFATASKPGYGPALGLEALSAATATGLPVFALGGISAANIAAVRAAGAEGAAIMGEAMRAPAPAEAMAELVGAWKGQATPASAG